MGPRGVLKCAPGQASIPTWRPFGAPRAHFVDFLASQEGIEKTTIFRIAQNRPKWHNQPTLGSPMSAFWPKNMHFGVPFCIDFSTFSWNCKNAFGAYSFTDSMVFDHQKPLIFNKKYIFHVFSKTLQKSIFGRQRCCSLVKSAILEPFWEQGGDPKSTLGRHFWPQKATFGVVL